MECVGPRDRELAEMLEGGCMGLGVSGRGSFCRLAA
jgi:hypothetical protein